MTLHQLHRQLTLSPGASVILFQSPCSSPGPADLLSPCHSSSFSGPSPRPYPLCPLFPGNSPVWLWAQVVQEVTCFLHRLALMQKDYAVVLCCLGGKEALSKVLDKHSTQLLLASELRHLVAECEKYAQLCSNLTSSILAGCIQVRRGL